VGDDGGRVGDNGGRVLDDRNVTQCNNRCNATDVF